MSRGGLALALILIAARAIADQWLPPTPQTYTSDFGSYRLTVFPRQIESPLAFFQDKTEGTEPAGAVANAPTRCEATMERLVGNHYEELWRHALVNDVAPVTALVSDRSGTFVTFDNWHSIGCCRDTIVIYDAAGGVVRMFALKDLFTKTEIGQFERTVSSIHWGGEHTFRWVDDDEVVELAVVSNGKFPGDSDVEYRRIHIRLRDGAVIQSSDAPPN